MTNTPPDLAPGYKQAAEIAIKSLQEFNEFLRHSLTRRTSDWRLGQDLYRQKFRYVLDIGQTPEQTLSEAREQMRQARAAMAEEAAKILPQAPKAIGQNDLVRQALDLVADRHGTRETYFTDARGDLAEATAFVRQANLLTLPPVANLQVIETPEFMRGIYAVGGFNPAPALQPQLGAFYWLTPVPPSWPEARVESKLREYNYYGLKLLTIHEAMPGHYVQAEFANRIEPTLRRLLRGILGNGPYIEGWAMYATEMMLDEGYLGSPPELRLTFLKQQLRVFANAILDIELQSGMMSDEGALRLMIEDAFQEREEAVAKLQRAKLSSAQLPTYFVGWSAWWKLRRRYQQHRGPSFSKREFHDTALRVGAVPLPVLSRLLTGQPL
jgi:uncharacterized protein (DUF885 family)